MWESEGLEVAARILLTMACGPYDRMEALAQGLVQPEGIDLRYLAIQSPPEIFARMIKTHSFDIAEMSLAHYSIMRTRGTFPFIAMPVFPSRLFRHGYIFINMLESGEIDAYFDRLPGQDGRLKLRERLAVLDSRQVDTLLVVPI